MRTSDLVYMLRSRDNDVVASKAADRIEELESELNKLKEQVSVLVLTTQVSREIRSAVKEARQLANELIP